jgi:hypothetical protein
MSKFFYLCLVLFICSCDVMDRRKIKVYNDTSDTIFCIQSDSSNFEFYETSPLAHSISVIDEDTLYDHNLNIIYPNGHVGLPSYNWKFNFDEGEDHKVYQFFFKLKTLKEKNWDMLRDCTIYDKMTSVTFDQIKQQNWEVHYGK